MIIAVGLIQVGVDLTAMVCETTDVVESIGDKIYKSVFLFLPISKSGNTNTRTNNLSSITDMYID